MSKIFLRREGGTQGRGVPVLTSQRMEGPSGNCTRSKLTEECWGRGGGGSKRVPTESSAKRLRHPMPNDMLNNNWKEAGENTVAQQEADISDARSAPISDLRT